MVNSKVLTPNDKVVFAAVSQLTIDLAVIKEKVNRIEDRLESITVSIDKIEYYL